MQTTCRQHADGTREVDRTAPAGKHTDGHSVILDDMNVSRHEFQSGFPMLERPSVAAIIIIASFLENIFQYAVPFSQTKASGR